MKVIKIFGIIFLALVIVTAMGMYFGGNWVNQNLESVINSKPERKYNFNFDKVDFDFLKRVILISDVKITPVGKQDGVYVEGEVSQVLMNKLGLWKFFLHREVEIKELLFSKPEFVIHIPLINPEKEKAGDALQGLFGDILSRGGIENFEVGQASARIVMDGRQIGSMNNFNIKATELRTDSLKWNYPIPFDFGRIYISIDSMDYQIANGQHLKIGKVGFDTQTHRIKLEDISLNFARIFSVCSECFCGF